MTDSTLDERFSGVLAPDAMLPSQFFAMGRGAPIGGERKLMVAVLEDALRCFQKLMDSTDPKQQQLFREAEKWITTDNPSWFFSFANVCETLDINPDYVREGLMKWREGRRQGTRAQASMPPPGHLDDGESVSEEPPLRMASGE
jgi:hypothetical protein